ncbi:Flp family type IVb pilin [Pelagibaculum spongiae]|uniref:Pilus assembly protein n=1 Tax=Pelagibaculum spongiae TaxID=2080658 RepID=A0A2V1GYZ1_9GAMM|nr:hypothetical protein [Pelagibaculum spongiae]PVZ68205.1 hypothetical protein DC094_12970 [Pelagibaculum spongiae]
MALTRTSARRQFGQGMTEYIIIVALIAVAAIGVYRLFGDTVRGQTAAMAMELGGQDGTAAQAAAATAAGQADTDGQTQRNLNDFTGNN